MVVSMASEWVTFPCSQASDTAMQDQYQSDEVLKNGSGTQLLDDQSITQAVSEIVVGSLNGITKQCENLKANVVAFRVFLTTLKVAAKFVTNIFDMEDFEQVLHLLVIEDQCNGMLKEFKELRDLTGIVDGLIKGKINLEKYDHLRETDIAFVLEIYGAKLILGLTSEIEALSCLGTVQEAVMKRLSLDVEERMHLLVEIDRMNCYDFLDVLALDALREMNFEDLGKTKDSFLGGVGFSDLAAFFLWYFLRKKSLMLQIFSKVVLCPLSSGWFGPFSDDVVKTVEKADLRRRCEGQRYISVLHILCALGHSSIAAAVLKLVENIGFNPSCEPAKHPPYDIYQDSAKLASKCGAERVGVEHFALATVCGSNGSNLGAQGFDDSMWDRFLGMP